jgi:protein-S-isoprenylcysteine O-methyltransferase Ste14
VGLRSATIFKLIASFVLQSAIFAGLLFVPAGTLRWWRAWVFIGVMCVALPVVAMAAGVFPTNEDFLNERFKPPIQQGQPLADKIFVGLFLAVFVGFMVFISFDVFRLHLLGEPGAVVSCVGLFLVVAGWWIVSLASKENAFAAPVVRHQEERHQTVIDTGVYGVVRHPMYAGGVLLFAGMPLWLGSYAGALLASAPAGAIVLRIAIEEAFLRRELKGYDAYAARIRYRLIPLLW